MESVFKMKRTPKNHEGPERCSGFLKVTQPVGGGPRIWTVQLDSRDYTEYHIPLNVAKENIWSHSHSVGGVVWVNAR